MMGKRTPTEVRREIERLSREKETQREISAALRICTDTVRTVQKNLGLQPQPNKRTRGRLTAREKKEIARLYGEGKLKTDICERMKLTRNTVAAHISRMGLVAGLPEKKILSMRHAGFTQRQIARRLKLKYRAVFAFCRKHGFTQPRYAMTAQQIAAIDNAILNREATARSIAKNYRASYTYVLARAHALLECERFLGISRPPLSSYFPSRPPLPMKRGETMTAQRFVENFFPFEPRAGVVLTDTDVATAAKVLLEARRLFFGALQNEGQYLCELQHFVAAHLSSCKRDQENGWVN